MALDLIFGRTRRNWARGISAPATSSGISDEVTLRLTEPEIALLAELAATRAQADAGDGAAKKKLRKLAARVADLERRAARGDAPSARSLLVLRESGVLRTMQPVIMGGRAIFQPVRLLASSGGEQVSNTSYRVAVLRQARRAAGGQPPTTLDFARAKSAVDGAMRGAGISLFLPGSRPGRITA